jgi:beta-lactamase regulating signal transducer with metallopeptidase domain
MSIVLAGINAVSVSEQMINSVWLGAIIVGLVWLLLRAFSSRDPKARFVVWLLALFTVVALPLFGGMTPAGPSAVLRAPHLSLPALWAEYALIVWACVSLIGITRIAVGLLRLGTLRRHCQELSIAALPAEAQDVLRNFVGLRHVQVLLSTEVKAPTAIGFFRPAVLLPRWSLSDLSGPELRAVLLHELGHIRRWDDWTNLLQKLARAVFFFHPAVWWIDSKLCLEREIACDDLVLAHTGDSRSYAECLISLAEKSMRHRSMALAVAAVGRMRQMARRLSLILDHPQRTASRRASMVAVASAAIIACAGIVASPHLPALVVFQDGTSIATVNTSNGFNSVQKINTSLDSAQATQANVVPAVFRVPATEQNRSSNSAGLVSEKPARKQISVPKRNAMRAAMQLPKPEFRRQAILLVVETHLSADRLQSLSNSEDLSPAEFDSMPSVSLTVFRFDIGKGTRIVHSEFVSRVI